MGFDVEDQDRCIWFPCSEVTWKEKSPCIRTLTPLAGQPVTPIRRAAAAFASANVNPLNVRGDFNFSNNLLLFAMSNE